MHQPPVSAYDSDLQNGQISRHISLRIYSLPQEGGSRMRLVLFGGSISGVRGSLFSVFYPAPSWAGNPRPTSPRSIPKESNGLFHLPWQKVTKEDTYWPSKGRGIYQPDSLRVEEAKWVSSTYVLTTKKRRRERAPGQTGTTDDHWSSYYLSIR